MSHLVNCRISDTRGEELVNMHFAVHLREPGTPKLQGLYTNFDTVEGDAAPSLLAEETVLAAKTHEAEILNLDQLLTLFAARSRTATDDAMHVHRDAQDRPYVCWAGFTPTLEQMLTIVKAWTVFNAVNATAKPPIDPNEIANPLDLIDEFKLRVELTVENHA